MTYPIQIVERPEQPTLSIRTISAVENIPQVFGASYGAIGSYLTELGEYPAGMPFAIYYNLDMKALDVEIGFPVSKSLPGKESILPGKLPGGHAVRCLYTGPYEGMTAAYEEINHWMAEQECQPSGIVIEFYLNSPQEVPLSELQTEIVFPLVS